MNSPNYWLIFGCIVLASFSASGCGHIDEDLDLSDEEIEAKYADEQGLSIRSGMGGSYSSSCGAYGYSRTSHRSFSDARVGASPEVGEATRNGQNAQISTGIWLFVTHGDKAEDEPQEDDATPLKGRRLSTWGEYVAAEMARAKRLRAPKFVGSAPPNPQ